MWTKISIATKTLWSIIHTEIMYSIFIQATFMKNVQGSTHTFYAIKPLVFDTSIKCTVFYINFIFINNFARMITAQLLLKLFDHYKWKQLVYSTKIDTNQFSYLHRISRLDININLIQQFDIDILETKNV